MFACLDEEAGRADKEVNEIGVRLAAIEGVRSVFTEEVAIVDLVIVELAAEFDAVRPDHF